MSRRAYPEHVHIAGPHPSLKGQILAGLAPIEAGFHHDGTFAERMESRGQREILGCIVPRVHAQKGDEVAETGAERLRGSHSA